MYLLAVFRRVHGVVHALASGGGQVEAVHFLVRVNGAGGDALREVFVQKRAFRMQNADTGEVFRHFAQKSGVSLRVGIVTAALSQNRQHAAAPLHDHAEQRCRRASGRDVVRADIGEAVRVRDVRVERHDRNALLLAERVDAVAHECVRQRHERQSVDVFGRYQLVDERQLVLHIHVLHNAHDDRDIRDKLPLGKAAEQLAEHLHERRMPRMQHHADFPLPRLLHDQPVRDIAHFSRRGSDALRDLLAHALFMMQGAVHRAARHAAPVCDLLHRYHTLHPFVLSLFI